MAISDRISVMRQGQYMGTVNKEETSPLDLTKRMIGREVFLNIDKAYSEAGDTILEVQDVWIPSQKETSKIRGMSLHVKAGEIVGVAGIDGNGQSELVEAITGTPQGREGQDPSLRQGYYESESEKSERERSFPYSGGSKYKRSEPCHDHRGKSDRSPPGSASIYQGHHDE